jgi:hypothetical protein
VLVGAARSQWIGGNQQHHARIVPDPASNLHAMFQPQSNTREAADPVVAGQCGSATTGCHDITAYPMLPARCVILP